MRAAPLLTLTALVFCFPPTFICASPVVEAYVTQAQDPRFGTWQREVSDSTGRTKIVIELRDNGTYTKVLDAFLRGQNFHGSEQGTWTANGPLVRLSGDGNSPASGHDLRNYQKIR